MSVLQTLEVADASGVPCPVPLREPRPRNALHRSASARAIPEEPLPFEPTESLKMSNPQQELPLANPNTDDAIAEILEALKAITLDTGKTVSFNLPKASRHLQKALDVLGYEAKSFAEPTALYTDGKYIFHHEGYEKEVTAQFDEHGNLIRLVDNEGNSWKQFAIDYGVFDPRRVSCFLRQTE